MEVSIGGISFTIEEDAYYKLRDYLNRFEATIANRQEAREVMEDVEARVAEIFMKERKFQGQVIDMRLVEIVINHLGDIDMGQTNSNQGGYGGYANYDNSNAKRFYRDPDDKKIAGVCSGLSAYFGIDVTLIRIIFLVALLGYGSAFFLYIVLWIATKEAVTVAQKLEMRGIPVTAENIRNFTAGRR